MVFYVSDEAAELWALTGVLKVAAEHASGVR